jgi:ribonuclease HI
MMANPGELLIHTDGASRGNPGPAAYAYTIEGNGESPIEEAGCLGQMTNNQAEYTALVKALEHALEVGAESRLVIHSDSELLVKQMKGEYRVKNSDLLDLYGQARELVDRFQHPVRFHHIRRALNSRADALCNEALDGLRSPMPRASQMKPQPKRDAVPPAPSLREEALTCLRQAKGKDMAPEQVWQQLVALLAKHGIQTPS